MLCFKLFFFNISFCKYKNVYALVLIIILSCIYHLTITETQKTEQNHNIKKKITQNKKKKHLCLSLIFHKFCPLSQSVITIVSHYLV